jgi:hypothetical protein
VKPGDSIEAEDPTPCAFCPGTLYITAGVGGGRVGLIHTVPTCETFDRLEVSDFLAAAIAAKEARLKSPPKSRHKNPVKTGYLRTHRRVSRNK